MNARTVLVKIDSVMDLTGESWEQVKERVYGNPLDKGTLQWVWNVADGRKLLDLRFWVKEILDIASGWELNTRHLKFEQVLNCIIPPTRPHFHSGEICNHILRIRRESLRRLRPHLGAADRSTFIPRDGLARFLTERWVGTELSKSERSAAA